MPEPGFAEMRCDLTAQQLDLAVEVVESKYGPDPDGLYHALVAAALFALAANCARV